MLIYLARHGQTTGDLEDRYGGDYEDHLTEEGIKQARNLGQKLTRKNIEIIFCSPRIRAQETASLVNQNINVPVQIEENLRERNHYGILTGMIKSEAKEKYPLDVEKVKNIYDVAQNGESYENFKKRIIESWEKIINSEHNVVAVISHGGPIRLIFREILKIGEINISDCAYVLLKIENGRTKIELMDGIKIVEITK